MEVGPRQGFLWRDRGRLRGGQILGNDLAGQFQQFAALLCHRLADVGDDGGATEAESNGHPLAGGVEGIGVNAAGEWLGGLAEFGVDAAETFFIEEDAAAIGLVSEAMPGVANDAAHLHEDRLVLWDAVRFIPALLLDALLLGLGDEDAVLLAAAPAIVAAPVLEGRKFELEGHETFAGQVWPVRIVN